MLPAAAGGPGMGGRGQPAEVTEEGAGAVGLGLGHKLRCGYYR